VTKAARLLNCRRLHKYKTICDRLAVFSARSEVALKRYTCILKNGAANKTSMRRRLAGWSSSQWGWVIARRRGTRENWPPSGKYSEASRKQFESNKETKTKKESDFNMETKSMKESKLKEVSELSKLMSLDGKCPGRGQEGWGELWNPQNQSLIWHFPDFKDAKKCGCKYNLSRISKLARKKLWDCVLGGNAKSTKVWIFTRSVTSQ
jgi:hypothetical protein